MFQFFTFALTAEPSKLSAQSAMLALVAKSFHTPSPTMSCLKLSIAARNSASVRSATNSREMAIRVELAAFAVENIFRSSAFSMVVAKPKAVIISYSACFLAAKTL